MRRNVPSDGTFLLTEGADEMKIHDLPLWGSGLPYGQGDIILDLEENQLYRNNVVSSVLV